MSSTDRLRELETRLVALERERDSLRPGHPDDFEAMARVKTEIGQAKQEYLSQARELLERALGIASVVVPDEARGDLVHRSGGDRTLFAPPRGQVRVRGDRLPPLPDPFDVEGGE